MLYDVCLLENCRLSVSGSECGADSQLFIGRRSHGEGPANNSSRTIIITCLRMCGAHPRGRACAVCAYRDLVCR